LIEHNQAVSAVEVKTAKLKSLLLLLDTNPEIYEGIKLSADNFENLNKIQSIPLYAFGSGLEKIRGPA
jgi:hypothetical protein